MKELIKVKLLERFLGEQKTARTQVQMGAKLGGHHPDSPLNKLFQSNVQNLREITRRISILKKIDGNKSQNIANVGSLLKVKLIGGCRPEIKNFFIVPCSKVTGITVSFSKYEEAVIMSEDSKHFQKMRGAKTGETFSLEDNTFIEILKIS